MVLDYLGKIILDYILTIVKGNLLKGGFSLIYENVKRLCKERGIPIMRVETDCGIANGTIGKWESRNSSPRTATLLKVAKYLGVTLDELVNE